MIFIFWSVRYEKQLEKFCKFMDFLLDSPPPEIRHDAPSVVDGMKDKVQKSVFWSRCLQHVLSLGQKDMM